MSELDLQTSLPYMNGNPRHERPIWIWDRDTASFVWANGEGVKFWSANSLEHLQATPIDKTHPAWMTICQAFKNETFDTKASASYERDRGIGLNLYFPHKNGTETNEIQSSHIKGPAEIEDYNYSAVCRRGNLQNRTAIIVELISQKDLIVKDTFTDPSIGGSSNSEEASAIKLNGTLANGLNGTSSLEKLPTIDQITEAEIAEFSSLVPGTQLKELARLIKAAGGSTDEILTAVNVDAEPKEQPQLESAEDVALEDIADLPDNGSNLTLPKWPPLQIDLTALAGVGDQDELELLFKDTSAPYALISLQKIIHANDQFVSEVGYGDLDSLMNDGSDWIFPASKTIFSHLLDGDVGESTEGVEVGLSKIRLRSGRKLSRDVLITPVKLTKFNRVLLLLELAETFHFETEVQSSLANDRIVHSYSNKAIPLHSDIEGSTSIPLLSAVSHEVRTPLNVIIGFSELMALEQFGPLGHEKYQGYAQDIHKSAQHALSLINDLLDLTKLKAGKWDLEPSELEVNSIIRSQVSLMRELAAQRKVRLRSDLEENLPLVKLDERSLQQILLNLISNAIKFDREGGCITVDTERVNAHTIAISVSDTGYGMNEADIRNAMEPFHQVMSHSSIQSVSDKPQKKNIRSGTGLGLPISKALAEANGMEFTISSQENEGTRVTLTIPV